MRIAAFMLLMLLAGSCGFVLLRAPDRGAFDFQAFYCAGAAMRSGADPYRTEPLGECEHRQTNRTYAALPADVVLPAPLPGYDIAAFALLALLPFALAKAVWGAVLAIAIGSAIVAAAGATRAGPVMALFALTAALVFPALAFGELFALFAAASCAAMYFASKQRWRAAGIAAALSLVEPHLGVPLCLALLLLRPQARVPLLATLAALTAIALGTLGVHANLEYVTTVLPLHALAEIGSDAQLSVSTVLHAGGIPDRIAVFVGTLFYAAAAIAGIALGNALAVRTRQQAFLVAVPAAFAVMGGTFIHVTEIFAAVPLALLFATIRTRYAAACSVALILLSVPWYMALERGNAAAFAGLGAVVVFYLAWRTTRNLYVPVAGAALAFALLFAAPGITAPASHVRAPSPITDASYPQASWQAWTSRELSSGSAASWVLRSLSWCGLLLLGAGTALLVRDPHGLLVDEFADAEFGKLSAVPAALDAAER